MEDMLHIRNIKATSCNICCQEDAAEKEKAEYILFINLPLKYRADAWEHATWVTQNDAKVVKTVGYICYEYATYWEV